MNYDHACVAWIPGDAVDSSSKDGKLDVQLDETATQMSSALAQAVCNA